MHPTRTWWKPEIHSQWRLDPVHTFVRFSVPHRGISRICGRFDEVDGSLRMGEGATGDLLLALSIGTGSINTGHLLRDSDLRSELFLDAPRHPAITFSGARVAPEARGRCRLEGSLSLRGVERPLAMRATIRGGAADPDGCERLGVRARVKVDRRAFGVGGRRGPRAGCGELGRMVSVAIDAQFIREAEGSRVA